MSSENRKLTYSLAINEALKQLMMSDSSVFIIGQGVKSPWYVGNTCKDLVHFFGEGRVIDTPVSENAITGAAVGASLTGMKSICVHPRMDFSLYAFDPIINQASNWLYMNYGRASVNVVFWMIINRGGEQAAQHSQALYSIFTHIPGLKVVAPSNPFDAKGLLISAVHEPNPVVYIDDRWLYSEEGIVPEKMYEVPIGKGNLIKIGGDITIVSSSFLARESLIAAEELVKESINTDLIDLRSLKPIDYDLIFSSVKKTGRLLIVDGTWRTGGISAEISATVNEKLFGYLKSPVARLSLPDTPAPASRTLEAEYYIKSDKIIKTVKKFLKNNFLL